MKDIVLKIIGVLFTKEKLIGYGVGVALAVAGAALDMQPKELRDTICKTYSAEAQ